jgi:hypothetical protein
MGVQERAGTNEQRTDPVLDERCKGGLDVAVAADICPIACAAACTSRQPSTGRARCPIDAPPDMAATKRDHELVAHLAAERARLGKA